MTDENWIEVAKVDDMDDEEAIRVTVDGKAFALYFVAGTYYATDDLCTHEGASLSEGFVNGATIECPLHQGVFCLKTGKALQAPVEKAVAIFPVRVVDSKVCIRKLS